MYHATVNAKHDARLPTVTNDVGCRASTLDFSLYARCCSLAMEKN